MSATPDRSIQELRPTVWIGKQGCTDAMIDEIVAQLKKRGRIKIKWLQNTEVDPHDIAVRSRATLTAVRGRTMVLAQKEKANDKKGADSSVTAAGNRKFPHDNRNQHRKTGPGRAGRSP